MNPRVLELLKNPKNIQSEDLGLLKEEIYAFPYVQNIRALHLFGVPVGGEMASQFSGAFRFLPEGMVPKA